MWLYIIWKLFDRILSTITLGLSHVRMLKLHISTSFLYISCTQNLWRETHQVKSKPRQPQPAEQIAHTCSVSTWWAFIARGWLQVTLMKGIDLITLVLIFKPLHVHPARLFIPDEQQKPRAVWNEEARWLHWKQIQRFSAFTLKTKRAARTSNKFIHFYFLFKAHGNICLSCVVLQAAKRLFVRKKKKKRGPKRSSALKWKLSESTIISLFFLFFFYNEDHVCERVLLSSDSPGRETNLR